MRAVLVRGAIAITSMIAIAFGVPTGLAIAHLAQDRAQAARIWWVMGTIAILIIAGSALAADRLAQRTLRKFAADMDAERELAADLSHRLRTPLAALRLDTDALPPGPVAARMRDAIAALDHEVDAVILGARTSGAERAAELTDLVDVLADRLAFWAVLAEDQVRQLEVRGAGDPVLLTVPRADAIAAIDAMLGNVFEHTPQGAPLRITVSPRAFVVEDGGPGIADPQAALLRGISSDGSTGLGLDIVARIARRVGGELKIDRGELGGARLTVALPS